MTVQPDRAGKVQAVKRPWLFAVAFLVILALVPLLSPPSFVLHGLLITCLWAGLALAWNILAGFAGQFSFGHAAFFGIGAYTTAQLYATFGITPWIGMFGGGAVAAVFAAAIGVPAFRLRGPYFSLATLAFAEVTRIVAVYWESVTGGAVGFFMPMQTGLYAMSWTAKAPFLWVSIGYLGAVWLVAAWVRRSRLGYFMAAVRADQEAAAVAGVNPTAVKMWAAMISAFLTGIGGSIFACYLTFIDPGEFIGVLISIQFLIMTIVGGLGTLVGPVVGAFIATPIAEVLRAVVGSRFAGGMHQLIYGIVFVLIMLYMPKGIWPAAVAWWKRRRHRGEEERP